MADKRLAGRSVLQVARTVCVLVGAGRVEPGLDESGDEARSASTRQFNTAIMRRARFSTELSQLASPVTGGGVVVPRFSQLFLLADQEGEKDPAQYVWGILSSQGHRLIKDGKIIEDAKGNLAELKSLHDTFTQQQLPVLQQLKVA